MEATQPVAVVVPTRNRASMLRRTLDAILAQSVPAKILVMDDASSDETEAMVRRDYPQAAYFREDRNRGPTFQRNKGVGLGASPIVFTIDDDCILASPTILQQTLDAFDHPRVGAVTLPFINVLQDSTVRTAAPDDGKILAGFDYFGGMVAFRRDVFLGIGGYRTFLFMHMEESDLAIRLLDAGYIVRLGWAQPLQHMESPLGKPVRLHDLGARNNILYCFYNVPWPQFPLHLAATTVKCLHHATRVGYPMRGVRGVLRGYAGILHEIRRRDPVSRTTYRLSRILRDKKATPLAEIEPQLSPMRSFSAP